MQRWQKTGQTAPKLDKERPDGKQEVQKGVRGEPRQHESQTQTEKREQGKSKLS